MTDPDVSAPPHRRAGWADLRAAVAAGVPVVVIDVRSRDEWEDGHLRGAVHVAVHDVERVAPALPDGELWVHCRTGHRAGIVASLLQRTGRRVVHVDARWDDLPDLGLELAPHAA